MRRLLALALAYALLAPGTAAAQERHPVVFLTAGPSLPVGGHFDVHNIGFNIDGGYERSLTRSLGVRGEVGYSRFPLDKEELLIRANIPLGSVEVTEGARSVVTALATATYRLGRGAGSMRPYLLGGLGYWRVSQADLFVRHSTGAETLPGDTDNGVAGALGAGIDMPVGEETTVFVEGRYVAGWDFADPPDLDEGFIPFRIGVTRRP